MYKHLNNIKHITWVELMTSNHLKALHFQFKLAERKKPLTTISNFTLFLPSLISFGTTTIAGENRMVEGHVNATEPKSLWLPPLIEE